MTMSRMRKLPDTIPLPSETWRNPANRSETRLYAANGRRIYEGSVTISRRGPSPLIWFPIAVLAIAILRSYDQAAWILRGLIVVVIIVASGILLEAFEAWRDATVEWVQATVRVVLVAGFIALLGWGLVASVV